MWRRVVVVIAVGVLSAGCSVGASSPVASSPGDLASAPVATAASARPTGSASAAPSVDLASPVPSLAIYAPVGSPEPAGTALVMHRSWDDVGPHLDLTVALADGRLISMARDLEHGWVLEERQLSPLGLELVQAGVSANPLFERSQWRPLVASPPACCGAGDQIVLLHDGREITVGRAILPADVYAPSAAWDDFERLLGWLDTLETWLPDDAWLRREARPYAAASYRAIVMRASGGEDVLGSIVWPAGFDPASFGAPSPAGESARCGVIDAHTALAISGQADALRLMQGTLGHPTLAEAAIFDSFVVRGPGDGTLLSVALEPLMPHQSVADAAAACATGY
jgi:hypothetical protein